jgi:pimeloyl-ACP methyl ester carboxylesterase
MTNSKQRLSFSQGKCPRRFETTAIYIASSTPDPKLSNATVRVQASESGLAQDTTSRAASSASSRLRLARSLLARPGADEVQLDLFGDYQSNVARYPSFQRYFRMHKPPLLAVWGRNDPFFLPAGAEAFRRDIPHATVRFVDTGHFALETHSAEIAKAIGDFLAT